MPANPPPQRGIAATYLMAGPTDRPSPAPPACAHHREARISLDTPARGVLLSHTTGVRNDVRPDGIAQNHHLRAPGTADHHAEGGGRRAHLSHRHRKRRSPG